MQRVQRQEMVHEARGAGGRSDGLRRSERAQSHRCGALPELGTAKGCPGGDQTEAALVEWLFCCW